MGMITFTTEDRLALETIPLAGMAFSKKLRGLRLQSIFAVLTFCVAISRIVKGIPSL